MRKHAALRTFFLWLLEPAEASRTSSSASATTRAVLDEFRRIQDEPTGENKKARTFRIALEGGIGFVEGRIAWLDAVIEEIGSAEWEELDPG